MAGGPACRPTSAAFRRSATSRPTPCATTRATCAPSSATWRSGTGAPSPPSTAWSLRRYLAELRAEGMAAASIVRKVSTIRSFYRFLARQGRVEQDPLVGVRGPKKGRRLPSFLTAGQVLGILAAVQGDEPKDLRDRAILELFYAAGLRLSELVGLDTSDVDLGEQAGAGAGQGQQGAHRPDGAVGGGRPGALPEARAAGPGAPAPGAGPLPEQARRAALGAGGAVPAAALRPQGGPGRAGLPPPVAPHLRHPYAGRRGRPARGAGASRSRQGNQHPDLHPRQRRREAAALPEAAENVQRLRRRGEKTGQGREVPSYQWA